MIEVYGDWIEGLITSESHTPLATCVEKECR